MIRRIALILILHFVVSTVRSKNNNEGALTIVGKENTEEHIEENDDTSNISEENPTEFQPTKSWQKIQPGQSIPAGLHIRINLETGEKEAKLLDSENDNSENEDKKFQYYQTKSGREKIVAAQNKRLQELKDMLKSLKEEKDDPPTKEDTQHINSKFRNIEELKKEFQKFNLNVKTDAEMLTELLQEYPKAKTEKKINILHDIEYLVHQYDAAQVFVKLGGLQLIVPDFNSTSSKLRTYVAFTIGSAMQGNPPVQIAVYEANVMQQLLRLLVYDATNEVQLRVLYALSCLLRQFPLAQQHFMESGGLLAFVQLFKQNSVHAVKLQMKAITLLHDLVIEQQHAEQYAKKDKVQEEKLKQYKTFNLQDGLVQHDFCSLVPRLLLYPDFDTQEKIIQAMMSLSHLCHHQFGEHLKTLQSLMEKYREFSLEETVSSDQSSSDNDLYFTNLYHLIQDLVQKIQQNVKDEL